MRDEVFLRDEDRLPWLETVEPDEEPSSSIGRIIALVVVGLAVLAGIAFAVVSLQGHGSSGTGQLIPPPATPYKVRPEEPGGLKVEGEGDSAIATSQGRDQGNGAIDLAAVPEAPVATGRTPASAGTPMGTPAAAGRTAVAEVPARGGRLVAPAPLAAERPAASTGARGGSLVQLGAYPSEAVANASWDRFAKRFGYLAALTRTVQPVARDGKTLYRLRVDAGSANQAAELCGRLRVAGEACFVAG